MSIASFIAGAACVISAVSAVVARRTWRDAKDSLDAIRTGRRTHG